jgi:putative restriction endonuclease
LRDQIAREARVGQHVFALNVLTNCGRRCVFCGLNPSRAWPEGCCWPDTSSHGKNARPPSAWTRATAWPPAPASHDVAFDTGMLTVTADLKIHIAQPLADAARGDRLTRQYYGRPPLLATLLFPDDAQLPKLKYLDWHREKIFVA